MWTSHKSDPGCFLHRKTNFHKLCMLHMNSEMSACNQSISSWPSISLCHPRTSPVSLHIQSENHRDFHESRNLLESPSTDRTRTERERLISGSPCRTVKLHRHPAYIRPRALVRSELKLSLQLLESWRISGESKFADNLSKIVFECWTECPKGT